eukprot:m.217371 g.217371  ORF g.217371 m.217371 type:complete len:518 (+) comp16986_c23_seq2:304-1857(+)
MSRNPVCTPLAPLNPQQLTHPFKITKTSHILDARALRRVAVKCLQQNDLQSAAHNFREALRVLCSGPHSTSEEVSIVVELVKTLLKSNQLDEAEPLIRNAYKLLSSANATTDFTPKLRWSCCFQYGRVALKQRKFALAFSLLKDARRIAEQLEEAVIGITHITFAQVIHAKSDAEGCQPYEFLMAIESVQVYIASFERDNESPVQNKDELTKLVRAYELKALLHRACDEELEEKESLDQALALNHKFQLLSEDETKQLKDRLMELAMALSSPTEAEELPHAHSAFEPQMPPSRASPAHAANLVRARRTLAPGLDTARHPSPSRLSSQSRPTTAAATMQAPSSIGHIQHRLEHRAASVPSTRCASPTRTRRLHTNPQRKQSYPDFYQPTSCSPLRSMSPCPTTRSTSDLTAQLQDTFPPVDVSTNDLKMMSLMDLRMLKQSHRSASQRIDDALLNAETREAYVEGKAMAVNCKVCMSQKVSVCLMPCRHACLCSACANAISECPVCRVEVTDKLAIFL